MIIPVSTLMWVRLLAPITLAIGVMAWSLVWQLPGLRQLQTELTEAKTSLLALEQQEQNLDVISRQLAELADRQSQLDREIWQFTREEEFFAWWETLAETQRIELDGPELSDVVPSDARLLRPGSVQITGAPNRVFAALSEIQRRQPVIGIQSIQVTPIAADRISATVEYITIWQ